MLRKELRCGIERLKRSGKSSAERRIKAWRRCSVSRLFGLKIHVYMARTCVLVIPVVCPWYKRTLALHRSNLLASVVGSAINFHLLVREVSDVPLFTSTWHTVNGTRTHWSCLMVGNESTFSLRWRHIDILPHDNTTHPVAISACFQPEISLAGLAPTMTWAEASSLELRNVIEVNGLVHDNQEEHILRRYLAFGED